MKSVGVMVLIFFFPALLFAAPGDLQESYRKMVEKRKQLEEKRVAYEKRQNELSENVRTVIENLNQCVYENRRKALRADRQQVYDKWRILWESRLREAELIRETAENERRNILLLWRELSDVRKKYENRRREIEKKYHAKHRGKAYETEFRNYMDALKEEYLDRIESELFQNYKENLEATEGYLMFLINSLELCLKEEWH